MKIRSGHPFYGQEVGILVNASAAPRVPGDAGHAATFAYPVRYQVTGTSFMDLVEGSDETREKILAACRALREAGVRGIVADCGLMSLYQAEVVRAVGLPFVGSSLCQIPLVWQLAGRQGAIGVLTGHSDFLRPAHLRHSGWDPSIPLSIQGMECQLHFAEVVIRGGGTLNVERMRQDVLRAARVLREKTPELRAVILECSNLATYSRDVAQCLEVPVFDAVSAANLLHYSLEPPRYL